MQTSTWTYQGHPPVKTAPGPRGKFFLGVLGEYRKRPLSFLLEAWRTYGDVVRMRSGPFTWHLVAHPDAIQYVLRDHYPNFGRSFVNAYLKLVLGTGLLTNEGESWLHQRRLMQPTFHRKHIVEFGTMMTDAATATAERWQPHTRNNEPIDVAAEMMRLTYQVICRTMFSIDLSDRSDTVGEALAIALHHINYRTTHLFAVPERFPTPRNRRFQRAVQQLDEIVYGLIEERRHTDHDPGDLLSMLLQARDAETGAGMTDRQLRDELMTIMLAGHETTAVALSWTWYLLSKHPTVARRLHQELDAVLGGRVPTVADLPHLPYTQMVLQESMRLYPPAWIISRAAAADDTIQGYHIPAGTAVIMSAWVTHRHPTFWENPEGFDPERFAPERAQGRHPFAYIPFGGGPRICIGNEFAMLEARLILATLAQRYQLHLVPGQTIEPQPLVTLRPNGPIWMTLQERKAG